MNAVPLLLFAIPGLLGAILLAIGVRGRSTRTAPSCARCGHGLPEDARAVERACAECGRALDGRDAVRHFRLRPRVPLLVAGLGAIAIAAVAPGIYAYARMPGGGFRGGAAAASTDDLIAAIAPSEDASRRATALRELSQRASGQTLSGDEALRVIDAILALPRPLDAWVGIEGADVIIGAAAGGILDDARLRELGRALAPPVEFPLPERIRAGAGIRPPFDRIVAAPVASVVELVSMRDAAGNGPSFVDGRGRTLERIGGQAPNYGAVRFDMPPGRHELLAEFEVRYEVRGAPARRRGGPPPLAGADDRVSIPLVVEIVPADAPSLVALDTDPARAAEVRAACSVGAIYLIRRPSGACMVIADVRLDAVRELALSYRVEIEIAGERQELGRFLAVARGQSTSYSSSGGAAQVRCPTGDPPSAIVRFLPDPLAVETDPRITTIRGDIVEFADLPVQIIDAPERVFRMPEPPRGGGRR